MTAKTKAPAPGANGSGRVAGHAQTGRPAQKQNNASPAPRQGATHELRITTTAGKVLRLVIDRDDPHWRAKALARIRDPLSPEACAIRRAPMTLAEQLAWDEQCRAVEQILLWRELAEARRAFEEAAP